MALPDVAIPSWRLAVPPGRARWLLGISLGVAALLRGLALDKPLYIDEIVTLTVATQPLARMGEVMQQIDASPALYPLLQHVWLLAGRADWWARLMPALFGVLAVAVVALLTSRLFGWRSGVAAAWVMALAPAHVHYAQYVRSYSLFTLLASIHLWIVIDWFDAGRPIRRGRVVALIGVTAALLYTHYLSLLMFPAEGLFALWHWGSLRQRVMGWAGAVAVAGLLFLPGLPLLFHNLAFDRVRNEDRPRPSSYVRAVPDLIGEISLGQRSLGFGDPGVRRATLAAAAVVLPVLFFAGVASGWRERPGLTLLLVLFSWLPFAIYVGTGRRLLAVRFFLPFMAGYVALLGHGIASLRPRMRAAVAVVLLVVCAVPLWQFYRSFSWSYDHRAVARAMGSASEPGDVLLVVQPYEAFYYRWYMGEAMPITGLVFTALEDQERYVIKPPPLTLEQARTRVLDAASRHPRLWLVGESTRSFASDAAEEARLLAWMDETFDRVSTLDALTGGDPTVRLYAVRSGSP